MNPKIPALVVESLLILAGFSYPKNSPATRPPDFLIAAAAEDEDEEEDDEEGAGSSSYRHPVYAPVYSSSSHAPPPQQVTRRHSARPRHARDTPYARTHPHKIKRSGQRRHRVTQPHVNKQPSASTGFRRPANKAGPSKKGAAQKRWTTAGHTKRTRSRHTRDSRRTADHRFAAGKKHRPLSSPPRHRAGKGARRSRRTDRHRAL